MKAYCPTERTEHATIAWSDCAVYVYVIIITRVGCVPVENVRRLGLVVKALGW